MLYGFDQSGRRENELGQKRQELSHLRARHAKACALLKQLRDEIDQFEKDYESTLGRRMAELERIEAEIAMLTGQYESAGPRSGWNNRQRDFAGSAWSTGRQQPSEHYRERRWKSEEQDIKSLYREVAKAVHPDLADSAPAQILRNELMSKANRAYASEDRKTLQEILRQWGQPHNLSDSSSHELAMLRREIAREREQVRAVEAEVAELKGSYACRFKLRADASGLGNDLFAEMVAVAELNIARAQRRLHDLKRAMAPREDSRKPPEPTRKINFPEELCRGTLYLRNGKSHDYSQWKKAGPAAGPYQIDLEQAVRLDIRGGEGASLRPLQQLGPHDLQSLFLYDVCDADLDFIIHLAGLEELYLSGSRLTDAALLAISALTNLKRIYIYQTGISDRGLSYLQRLPRLTGLTSSGNCITDAGLAGLERAVPRVKTVSFLWKR